MQYQERLLLHVRYIMYSSNSGSETTTIKKASNNDFLTDYLQSVTAFVTDIPYPLVIETCTWNKNLFNILTSLRIISMSINYFTYLTPVTNKSKKTVLCVKVPEFYETVFRTDDKKTKS